MTTMTTMERRAHAGAMPPDPEVPEKPKRRRFTAEYKLWVIEQADRATDPGEVAALLRREGLYSSHLAEWRKQRRQGSLAGLSARRGRKGKDPKDIEIERLRAENTRLETKLEQAETIIAVQKKLSQLLGIETPTDKDTES